MASDYEDDAFEEGSFELPGMDSRPASAAASHSSFFGDEQDKQHVEQYKAGKSSPTASSASAKSPSMTSLTSGQPKPSIFSTADASRSNRVVSELDALVQRSNATKAAVVSGGDDEQGDEYEDEFPTDDDAGSVASEEGAVARNPSPEPALRVKPVEPAKEVVEALTPGPRVDIDSPIVKPKPDMLSGSGAPAPAPAPFVFKRAPLVSSTFEAPPVVPVASYAPKPGPSGDEPQPTSVFRAPAPAPVRQPIPQYDEQKLQSDAEEYSDEYSEPDDDKPTASSQTAVTAPKPGVPSADIVAPSVQPPVPVSSTSNGHAREKRMSVNAHSRRSSFQHTDAGDDYADDGYDDDEFAGDDDGENSDDDDDADNTFLTSPSSKSAKPPAVSAVTSPVVHKPPVVVAPLPPQPQPQPQPATVVIDAVVKAPKPAPNAAPDTRDDAVRTPVISAGSSVSVQSSSVTAPVALPSSSKALDPVQPSVGPHTGANKPVIADHAIRPAVAPVAAKPLTSAMPAPEPQRPSVHRSAAAAPSPLAPVTPPISHKHQPKRQSPATVAVSQGRRTPKDFPIPKEVEERIRSEHARVVAATTIQLAYRAYRHRIDLKHVLSMKRRMMYFERDGGKSSLSKAYVAMAQHAASPMPAHGKVVYHKGVAYRADEYAALPAWHAPNYGTHGHGARNSGDRRSHSSAAVVNPKLMQGVRLHGDRDRVAAKPSLPAVATRSNTKPTQLYQGRQSGVSDPRARGRELAQQHARPGAKSTPPVSRRLSDDPPPPKRPVVYDSNGRRVAHPVEVPKPAPRPIVMNRNARPAWGSVHNAPAPKYAPPAHRARADGQRRSGPGIAHAGAGAPPRGRPVVPPDVKFEQPPSKLPVLKTRVGQDPTVVAYAGKDADPDGLLREQAMRMHRSKKELDAALYALQAGVPTKL